MSYLRNCWYAAGWTSDIGSGEVLGRTFLGDPVALFRTEAGEIGAVADTCPHRFAPLSRGKVRGTSLQCPYHGLQFAASGSCVINPHGPVTSSMAVRAYPIVERHRMLWIWMGDPAAADPGMIRDLSFFDEAPDEAFSGDYLRSEGEYQLFVDNLLDLTHIDYLHATTLGAAGDASLNKPKITENADGSIVVLREEFDSELIPVMRPLFPDNVTRTDMWSEMTWTPPGIIVHVNGHVAVGAPVEEARATQNVHCLTPETPTSTHYFFGATRNFERNNCQFNDYWSELRRRVFSTEDGPMIAAQQARMGTAELWDLSPIMLRSDEANIRTRRMLEKRIAAEESS